MNKVWLQDEEQQEEQHLEEMLMQEGEGKPFLFLKKRKPLGKEKILRGFNSFSSFFTLLF